MGWKPRSEYPKEKGWPYPMVLTRHLKQPYPYPSYSLVVWDENTEHFRVAHGGSLINDDFDEYMEIPE